jgi:hypothetical protein
MLKFHKVYFWTPVLHIHTVTEYDSFLGNALVNIAWKPETEV